MEGTRERIVWLGEILTEVSGMADATVCTCRYYRFGIYGVGVVGVALYSIPTLIAFI